MNPTDAVLLHFEFHRVFMWSLREMARERLLAYQRALQIVAKR